METFDDSSLCSGAATDIFELPDTDNTVISSNWARVTPFYSIQDGLNTPLRFAIPISSTQYMDLASSFMYIKAKVTNTDRSALTSSDIVAPSSMFFYTMFQSCEIRVNGTSVTGQSDAYAYEAGIQALLYSGQDRKDSALTSILYYKDTIPDVFDVGRNAGFKKRVQIAAASNTFDMVGKLPVNLFRQKRFLPPKTEVFVTFLLARPQFALDCASTTKDYTFSVDAAELYLKMHTLHPDILAEHRRLFTRKSAKYPFLDNITFSISVPAGQVYFESMASLWRGKLPTSIVLGMVPNEARVGTLNKTAWNFKNYGLKCLTFTSNNDPAMARRINMSFAKKLFLLGYNTICSTHGMEHIGNGISRDDYALGNSLYVLNLQEMACEEELHPIMNGEIKIGWASTVSWKAGDLSCRILSFFRTFGLYLSGFLIVSISLDRYNAVLQPLSLPEANRRGKIMLYCAWIGSVLCSIPQVFIFHVERHPKFEWFEQCVTFNSFPNKQAELAYSLFGFVLMYGFPLCAILFCYSRILYEIYKINRISKNGGDGAMRRSNLGALGRAKVRTLKLTITIVCTFFFCWTPYNVMSIWYWIDSPSAQKVDQRIQKCLFLFACTNSCFNPMVYGLFHTRSKSFWVRLTAQKRNNIKQNFNFRHPTMPNKAQPYKVRVRWTPRECLCGTASSSGYMSSSGSNLRMRPLYEVNGVPVYFNNIGNGHIIIGKDSQPQESVTKSLVKTVQMNVNDSDGNGQLYSNENGECAKCKEYGSQEELSNYTSRSATLSHSKPNSRHVSIAKEALENSYRHEVYGTTRKNRKAKAVSSGPKDWYARNSTPKFVSRLNVVSSTASLQSDSILANGQANSRCTNANHATHSLMNNLSKSCLDFVDPTLEHN